MQKRQRKRKRTRRTFFFCLLSKCSIRLFFSPSASQKKVERTEESCSTVVTPFFLSLLYVCVCSSSSPLVFFFCIYTRIWRLQTYISARKIEKKEKKIYIGCRKRMENTRTRLCFLNIDSSEGKEREGEGERRRASNHPSEKIFSKKEKRNKVVWKCVLM